MDISKKGLLDEELLSHKEAPVLLLASRYKFSSYSLVARGRN